MSNPLLQKYEELYGKKEEPKVIEAENAKVEIKGTQIGYTYIDEITKPPSLTTYDPDSLNVSFQQIAEQVKNGEAQVSSMNMEMDIMYGTKITFEVYVNRF